MNPHPRRWLILYVLLVVEIMDLLDSTIVNVAVPKIRADLGASSSQLEWIVGAYPLAVAAGLMIAARLGDLFGRRLLFVIGAAVFTIASMAAGLAPSAGALIAFRLVQGLGAAAMIPQGFGILRAVFPRDELPKAFALFGPVIGSAAIVGPIIGGGLVDLDLFNTGWRLVFYVNLPLGIAAVVGALLLIPEVRAPHARKLDAPGGVLAATGMTAIVYPLIQGRESGWPVWSFAIIGVGVALLIVFALYQELRSRGGHDTLVDPSLFRSRGYVSGLLLMQFYFAAAIGFMLTLTLFLQLGESYSPVRSGLALAPFAVGTAVGAGLSGAVLGPKFGRSVLQAGVVVETIGLLVMVALVGHGSSTPYWSLVPGVLLVGLGFGLVVAPLFDNILAAVSDRSVGSASGVLNALQQLSGAFGVALLATLFFDALGAGHFHHALSLTLWVEAGLCVIVLALSPLLPAKARSAEEVLELALAEA
ncbi:MAG TPA: DHA2 family efflux MFS transporter permease subunit [Gaiellaceae bacterium]|jgi:EmrB/QacA subfamily drug resistance transporter